MRVLIIIAFILLLLVYIGSIYYVNSTLPEYDSTPSVECNCPDKVRDVSIFMENQLGYDDYHGVYRVETISATRHRLYICKYWDYCGTYEKVVDGTIHSIKKEWGTGAQYSE